MMCDVCGCRLNNFEQWEGGELQRITWQHTGVAPSGTRPHEPAPVYLDPDANPRAGFCDFCIAPNPAWVFPAKPFHAPLLFQKGTDTLGWGSADNWAACHECRNDIEALKWESIERRYFRNKPVPRIPGHKNALRGDIRILHRQFRLNRLGPPFLIRRTTGTKSENSP